jgi:hypothetical protein
MSDKLRLALLAALVAALALVWWLGGRTPEEAEQRSFREVLLHVDTARLDSFILRHATAKHLPPLRFHREGTGWVARSDSFATAAFQRPMTQLLSWISDMRPMAMPGPEPEVRKRYDLLDSAAYRLDLPDGKLLWIGATTRAPEQATAVMLQGDSNVYLVPGSVANVLRMTFLDWIPKPMVNGDPAHWQRITFTFPGNVAYALERVPGGWTVNGQPADSLKVEKYLNALAHYYGSALADPRDTLNAQLAYQLRVDDRTRQSPVFLWIFQSGDHLIARSTLAPRWLVMRFDPQLELPRMFRPPEAFQ